MAYACPAQEFATDTYGLKLHMIGNFPRCLPIRDLRVASKIPRRYYFITKLCWHKANVLQNYENKNFCNTMLGSAKHRKPEAKLGCRYGKS